jgi:hypothetical protein
MQNRSSRNVFPRRHERASLKGGWHGITFLSSWSVPRVGFLNSAGFEHPQPLSEWLAQRLILARGRLQQGAASAQALVALIDSIVVLLRNVDTELGLRQLPVSEKQEVASVLNQAQNYCLPHWPTKWAELESYRRLTT